MDRTKRTASSCSSSSGNDSAYKKAAEVVGAAIARSQKTLVYGGGTGGLMGAVASAALKANGRVHGVIPNSLQTYERSSRSDNSGIAQDDALRKPVLQAEASESDRNILSIVETMHERKQQMAALSQAFIVLPGGYGTLEELAEMTTWSQLSIHRKPVICLNINNFFTPLRDFIKNAISAGFIRPENEGFLQFVDTEEDWGEAALSAIEAFPTHDAAKPYNLRW